MANAVILTGLVNPGEDPTGSAVVGRGDSTVSRRRQRLNVLVDSVLKNTGGNFMPRINQEIVQTTQQKTPKAHRRGKRPEHCFQMSSDTESLSRQTSLAPYSSVDVNRLTVSTDIFRRRRTVRFKNESKSNSSGYVSGSEESFNFSAASPSPEFKSKHQEYITEKEILLLDATDTKDLETELPVVTGEAILQEGNPESSKLPTHTRKPAITRPNDAPFVKIPEISPDLTESKPQSTDKTNRTVRKPPPHERRLRKAYSFPSPNLPSFHGVGNTRKHDHSRQRLPRRGRSRTEEELLLPGRWKTARPLIRFRRAVRIVQTLLRALTTSDREARLRNSELKFLLYASEDPVGSSIGGSGLYFDPSYYRAKKDMQLSPDAKQILSMPPEERTEEQKKIALLSLKSAVEAFAEFPIRMQQSLVSVGWYESYEASRVIIRQGHHAENFYMILTGTAVVTLSSQDPKTGETRVQTVAFLKKGNSFGELAIMHHSRRTATVSCQDGVELLAVGREDFVDIFMHRGDGTEPEFIQYLRAMEEFSGWPIARLPQDDPKICLYMYFRRGVVICKDSNTADWIYVVKSGTCRVLKKLQEVRPDIRALRSLVPDAQMALISPRSRSTASRHTPFPKGSKSRPSTQPNFRPSPEPQRKKSLPSIRIKSPNEVDRERIEFQRKLEEQRPETRANGPMNDSYAKSEFEFARSRRPPKSIYVQLQKLVEKDTFGLTPLILGEIEGGSMSTTLVSDGAECILINKKFFLHHLTQKHRKKLRLMLRPYPSESSLQQRLQDQTNWQAYKSMMLSTFPSFHPNEQSMYM